jgi:hypothetical protein
MSSVTEAGTLGARAAPLRFRPLLATAVGAKYESYPRGGARVFECTVRAASGGEPVGEIRAGRPELVRCWLEHLTARNKWQ